MLRSSCNAERGLPGWRPTSAPDAVDGASSRSSPPPAGGHERLKPEQGAAVLPDPQPVTNQGGVARRDLDLGYMGGERTTFWDHEMLVCGTPSLRLGNGSWAATLV